jgi:5-methyltetrahydrofolate--homocysteine methyltransferase
MTEKLVLEKVLVFDGAMGTMLQGEGLRPGACPEMMNVDRPEKVMEIHRAYIDAGADVITTNSFGGNRVKLAEYGFESRVKELNLRAVEIALKVAREKGRYVAASVGPTGRFVEPVGDMLFDEAYEIFKEQIDALAGGNPDFILLETFSDLGEIRAALLAARDACDIPVICCMTYTGERTLTGVSPASAAVILESLGASAVGANCSGGPGELMKAMEEMCTNTGLPVIVQPNAGLPVIKDGKVIYPMDPDVFVRAMEPYFDLGVNLLGSCCGSTPEYTRALKERINSYAPPKRQFKKAGLLASRERVVEIGENLPTGIVGERINPTARKSIRESLLRGDFGAIQEEAENQVENGAHLLDINVGVHGIDETITMSRLINLLQQNITVPLVIDNTNPKVLEKALKVYHGKALVNSVNGEESSLKAILPLIKRYGAGVIGLTLDENGIPASAEDRYRIAERIVNTSKQYAVPVEDIYIDCLVMTVGTDTSAAAETLKAIKMVKEGLKVNTVLGISNVSHGLPSRGKLNSAFLAMAIASGLDLAIVNPLDRNIMDTWQAACLLAGRDANAVNFLKYNSEDEEKTEVRQEDIKHSSFEAVRKLVIKGSQNIEEAVKHLLNDGANPLEIIDKGLIPGLNDVGEKFEKGEFYLPQLMLSAETAQKAFGLLEGYLKNTGLSYSKGTIVIGTVKGDIHDIGKNMVAIMLRNNGYRVIDLGKSVSSKEFIDAAQREKANYVALSALMTTTMAEIPGIVKEVKEVLPEIKVIVGGAVVTEEFARVSGADGYGKDAVNAVKIVERLRGN